MSRSFNKLNGKLPGPSTLVLIGMIGNPHAIFATNDLSYAECWA
jgi:hypothetical protein